MTIRFIPMTSEQAAYYRSGGVDANGQEPQSTVSDGNGNPCRHCLKDIPSGSPMLVFSHRPFEEKHPYAETGPIFLCGDSCEVFSGGEELPHAISIRSDFILRGYSKKEVIVPGTGKVTSVGDMKQYAASLLAREEIASVHVRSSSNNCFFCKIV